MKQRKPRLSIEEILKLKTTEDKEKTPPKFNMNYSIEFLAHLAMSPLCLIQPKDWERISQEYPNLIRNVSNYLLSVFVVLISLDI